MNQVSSGSLLLVGQVIRPHGKGGLLRIRSYARSEASFLDAGAVFLRPVSGEIREFRVTSVNAHKNTFLMRLKDLIAYIAKALVDKPEDVFVTEIEGEQTSVLELKVAKEDLGKVIGKQGRTARAMRTILSAASTKIKKRSVLEIIE